MKRKGGSGIITILVLLMIAALTVFIVVKLTESDIFDSNGGYIIEEAGNASIVDFKEKCKYYGYLGLVERAEELEDSPIYYNGKIERIDKKTFGGLEVYVRIKIPEEDYISLANKEEYVTNGSGTVYFTYIKVTLEDYGQIVGNEGDNVDVYGYFDKVEEDKETGKYNIFINGVRILERK